MIKARKRHIIYLVGCFCQGFFQELDLGKYSSCSFVQHKLPKLLDLKLKRSFWAHRRHLICLVGYFCQGFFQELDLEGILLVLLQHRLPKRLDLKMRRSF